MRRRWRRVLEALRRVGCAAARREGRADIFAGLLLDANTFVAHPGVCAIEVDVAFAVSAVAVAAHAALLLALLLHLLALVLALGAVVDLAHALAHHILVLFALPLVLALARLCERQADEHEKGDIARLET